MNKLIKKIAFSIDKLFFNSKITFLHKKTKAIRNINCHHRNAYKRVLISYVTSSFYQPLEEITHSNALEMLEILKYFIGKDYCIDVVDCLYHDFDFQEGVYDLVFGQGIPFLKAAVDKRAKKIGYLTEAYPNKTLENEKERLEYFLRRHKFGPKRNISRLFIRPNTFDYLNDEILNMSDRLILLGNQWTFSTYPKEVRQKITFLSPTAIMNEKFTIEKKIEFKKTHQGNKKVFLWFGSLGSGHKGLDIVLDAFEDLKLENIELWVFGLSHEEYKILKRYFKRNQNIKNLGRVRVKSEEFFNVALNADFVIFPSCSEANSTAVLTCMAHGIIPIVTKEVGVDILDDAGFILRDYMVETVRDKIQEVIEIPPDTLLEMQIKNFTYARSKFTLENFYLEFSRIMDGILCENDSGGSL